MPAERAHDSDRLHTDLALRGAFGNIRAMPQRKRRPRFSKALYRYTGEVADLFSAHYKSELRLFTYEEILKMVEASREGVTLEAEPLAETKPPETPSNSSPE